MKSLARIWIVIGIAHPLPVIAQEGAQLASCSYYQGEKVVKTDPSCIVYTVIDKGSYQGKIFWQDETMITRFSGNLNASLSNSLVDQRPATREDKGLGAYCFNFLDNGEKLCIELKN